MNQLYNFMRMLDAPGYPNSFVKLNKSKFYLINLNLS